MTRSVEDLLALPKRAAAISRRAREATFERADLELEAEGAAFVVFVRVHATLTEQFTIGLRLVADRGRDTVILRLNGDHGRHVNPGDNGHLEGPHLHGLRGDELARPPRAGAEVAWAWPLPPECASIDVAWRLFKKLATITSDPVIDGKIRSLQASAKQLEFGW